MIVSDDEAKELKTWVIKKLEDISDADSDVLADYVLALIRADAPEQELRANAIENLEDFLRENTARFVDEVLLAINAKAYLPGYVPPSIPSTPQVAKIPTGPSVQYGSHGLRPGGGYQNSRQQSRKRSYNDVEASHGRDEHYARNDRHMKQTRRGGSMNGNRGHFQNQNRDSSHQGLPGLSQPGQQNFSQPLAQPGNIPFDPNLDPNDPFTAIVALQALGVPIPPPPSGTLGGSQQERQGSHGTPLVGKNRIDARCRDYDTKGFCLRGVACPFNHGDNQVVVPGQPEEYDPKTAGRLDIQSTQNGANGHTENFRGRARGRGRGDRGGLPQQRRNRADFSLAGPNHNKLITTVVVEQIPEENFEESQVRDFFSAFGKIDEITMQPYKRLALVKFEDYYSAKAAYESPKVIFANRFVKVYWYNPNIAPAATNGSAKASSPASSTTKPETPAFDKEKFSRDAEVAQKKLEERKALQQQTESKLAEIAKQKEALAQRQAEEKHRLEEKLRAKGASVGPDRVAVDGDGSAAKMKEGETMETAATQAPEKKVGATTEALRAQVRALEAEAKSLGLDPDHLDSDPSTSWRGRGRGRGRGSYRGWDGFGGRGGGYDPSFRGGRGGYRGGMSARGGAGLYNLDNRPKRVKVEGVEFDDKRDEGLRQYLFSVGEFSSIDAVAGSKSALVVSFRDRFTAEKFFYGPKDLPGVGRLEFSWIANAPATSAAGTAPPSATKDDGTGDVEMDGAGDGDGGGVETRGSEGPAAGKAAGERKDVGGQETKEVDYDVAEDEDEWIS